jgi:hypothetical protein
MNIKHNPPRRTALIWSGLILIGLLGVFLPAIIGLDGFGGGFALSFFGAFVAILGIIAAVIYFRLAKSLDRITHPSNILAHWQYSQAEWRQYTATEHHEDATGRKKLFILVAVISLLVGLIFWALVRQNPGVIALIVLVIIAITGLTAWISGVVNYRNNQNSQGEVYIALDGAYLNRQLHVWSGLGNKLEGIVFEAESRAQPRIRADYSAPSNEGRNNYTARIPVPAGQEAVARQVVAQIAAAHLK